MCRGVNGASSVNRRRASLSLSWGMETSHDPPDPYDLVFGAESMDDRLFPPIAEEASARGLPLDDPERFVFLSSVGKLLQAIGGDEPYGTADEESDTGRDAIRQYGRLLYHAFQFWRSGKVRASVDEPTLRRLVEGVAASSPWTLAAPAASGYLRLPRNLIWAAPAPALPPEPADGFFWTRVEPADAPVRLHVLLALGVRPDRPGFSVVPTTGVVDREPHWADIDARPGGTDFETTLPGGELDRLYSIENAAELLKLASLCFRELDPARG